MILLYFGHCESCERCYSLSHSAFTKLFLSEKMNLTLLPPVDAYVLSCPVGKNKNNMLEELKIGHKIHPADIPMPNLLCSISPGVFSFSQDQGRQQSNLSQLEWKLVMVIPSSETCKPCLPGWVAVVRGLALHLFTAGAANTRHLRDQRNRASTTLWGTREALCRSNLRLGGKVLGGGRLTSQRCCVLLTAPACTFSGGRSTPWKGPIQLPCWILCAAQMP